MKRAAGAIALVLSGVVLGAAAYHFAARHGASQYAGLETREIKALSQSDVEGLKQGLGLGYALAAELNGYPGPRHVLELASELKLSPEQKAKTESLFAEMQTSASGLGRELVSAEKEIDQLFARSEMNNSVLDTLTAKAAEIDGKLRATHLRYHLAMMDVLDPKQIEGYKSLRGYHDHTGH
jgi:Spy/CpxP family protein refolding chaperone